MVTVDFVKPFIKLWKIPSLRVLTTPPSAPLALSTDSDSADDHQDEETSKRTNTTNSPYIFNEIVSSHYVRMLSMNRSGGGAFAALERFLSEMLSAQLITSYHLNDQCVALLREEWPVQTLNGLSKLLKNLVDNRATSAEQHSSDKESFMFMEMMSELSRDMDTF